MGCLLSKRFIKQPYLAAANEFTLRASLRFRFEALFL
jgi:hypothetical protein